MRYLPFVLSCWFHPGYFLYSLARSSSIFKLDATIELLRQSLASALFGIGLLISV